MEVNKSYHIRFQMHFSSSFFNPNHILEYYKFITSFVKTGALLTTYSFSVLKRIFRSYYNQALWLSLDKLINLRQFQKSGFVFQWPFSLEYGWILWSEVIKIYLHKTPTSCNQYSKVIRARDYLHFDIRLLIVVFDCSS